MIVTQLRIAGYRSIKEISLPLKRANVIVGPNGCGKSNLYQSISLIRAAAEGRLSSVLAAEGGLASALWAGPKSTSDPMLALGVTLGNYTYDIELGRPLVQQHSMFHLDPFVKRETLTQRLEGKKVPILERSSSSCQIRNAEGNMVRFTLALDSAASVLAQIQDVRNYPQLDDVRRAILKWRFYHAFRVDSESPLRQPRPGVRTYVMSSDGSDVAAALQTILENADDEGLHRAIRDAFPGSRLEILYSSGRMQVGMSFPGVGRPLDASELSDGTLRYLCLLAALRSPRPAPLLAVNEPETNLNEDLNEPLAQMIARAAMESQIWLTTHSHDLANRIGELLSVKPIDLEMVDGATQRTGRPAGLIYSEEWDG